MKKSLILSLLAFSFCVHVLAAEDPLAQIHTSLKDQAFVVETDEDSSAESLDRISGQYDLGFTLPDQEYDSVSHSRTNPLNSEASQEKSSVRY